MPKNRSPQLLRLMASVDTEKKAAVDGNLMPKKAAVDAEKKAPVDAVVMGMKQPRRRVRILVLASFSTVEALHPSAPGS